MTASFSVRFGPLISAVICSSLAFLGMVVVPSLSFAAESARPASVSSASKSVAYADLDLTTAQGIATLYGRIERTASELCGPAVVTGSRLESTQHRSCVRRAVAETVEKLDRPALSVYHQQRQGKFPVSSAAALNR
jgi:UrcA family protein